MATERPLGLRERKRIETWHAIHDAAMALFRERGYELVGIDDIAQAANVSRSTFFNYFATKESVLRDPAPGERAAWQYLLDRPDDEALWDALVAILVGFAEHISARLAENNPVADRSPLLMRSLRQDRQHPIYEDLQAFVARRTPDGAEFEYALLLGVALSAAETSYHMWSPTDGSYAEQLANALRIVTPAGHRSSTAAPTETAKRSGRISDPLPSQPAK